MEGDLVRINRWLMPLSWLYGMGVALRNALFDLHILKSHSYNIPIICIGNLSVGGTGKTPHTEYLLRLLSQTYRVAVLSRGYKRKTRGYILARAESTVEEIGDEPWQMKQKFPTAYVAVDHNRRRGIQRLCTDEATRDVDVILLDDAYQHRYVHPGVNILLVDYHRMITDDCLLPAGRLREPKEGKRRANIVIVTKCPHDIKPMGFRVVQKALNLMPYQRLYFSTFCYGQLRQLYGSDERSLTSIRHDESVLLLTGIAMPEQMRLDLSLHTKNITTLSFPDHHYYRQADISRINQAFGQLPEPRMIITTEKDAPRLLLTSGLTDEVRKTLYVLPAEVEIMRNEKGNFNDKITGYVLKNSRNSILAKGENNL
ncbi:MAG: tetraacyldisaccharide 4'-kinase [Bacteroidaceae bacterium]|nr:tetraacyldisaccharide 4'-kinase [Bacteroidaceae bacterium]